MKFEEISAFISKELKKAGEADFEMLYLESDDLTIELDGKKVDSLIKAVDKSLSLRVLKDDRIGFSYCTKLNEDGIKKMVENAFNTAKQTKADECNKLAVKDYEALAKLDDHDIRINDIPFEEKVDALKTLEDAAYGYDSRVKNARKLEFRQSLKYIRILNSLGIDCAHNKTVFSFAAMVAASEGEESEINWESDYSNFYDKLDPAKVGRVAAERACEALNAKTIGSETIPIILDRRVSSELLAILAPSFYADYIIKNKSSLKGKTGTKILSENITIVDDPLYDGGIASFPFDAEGSKSVRTVVVENGVLKSYLSDTYTSKKMGIDNTSNSIKMSLFAPPNVGSTNFFIVPGEYGFNELMREMSRGLIITEAMGLHTANPISGDFSIGIAGFFVEGGEKAYPVRGLVLSGNIFELLNNVVKVADDLKFADKSAAPSLLIKSADIAGKPNA